MIRFATALMMVLMWTTTLAAQETPAEPAGGEGEQAPAGEAAGRGQQPRERIKPYDKVITDKAETQQGVFKVHKVDNKWFYEIPGSELGREYLLVVTMARTTPGVSYGGQTLANEAITWERHGEQVLLRSRKYDVVASSGARDITQAVENAATPTILMTFPVEAWGPNESPVIDVSSFFVTELTEFSARQTLGARGFDRKRSILERINAYPTNIETEATHTYTTPPPSGPGGDGPPGRGGAGRLAPGSGSVVVHYSMVKLPENPMKPRLFDTRVGFFNIRKYDYGSDEHRAYRTAYIERWRLEKKDPSAAVSEPVKPIVYYVDPATPAKWVPYVKRGIEAWQPAFEEAGFRNAIIARDAPSKEEDPTWRAEDARYSVVRWVTSTIENAQGPSIQDPRTGETLDSDIKMWHNIQNLLRHWYFVQVAPLDPRARKLPLPDELMGRLIEFVVVHEVGHTLGLQHNMKGSSQYPVDKLRDKEWVKTMSHTPSIMDYSRFNYIAQPEDGIDPDDLIPGIGPYDRYAISWGYKPIPGAATPEDERGTLNQWIVTAQDQTPWLRFNTANSGGADPGELTEAVGDADAIQATTLGMKNLERVMGMLLDAVPQDGKSYEDLAEVYGRVLGQWVREMNHVGALVGGFWSREKYFGQEGVLFEPVARAKQAEAVRFLSDNAFETPRILIDKEISRRIEPSGNIDRITNAQTAVLRALLSANKIDRLVEQETLDGDLGYPAVEFLEDLRRGVFREIYSRPHETDAYRRNLQRAYIELLDARLNSSSAPQDDSRPLFRGELERLQQDLRASLAGTYDPMTRLHFNDLAERIGQVLEPQFARPSAAGQRAFDAADGQTDPLSCWQDLVITSRR